MSEISSQLDAARERLQSEPSPYLTIEEASQLARCDPSTLRRAIGSGALRSFRPAQRLLFREADVRDWIESRPAVRERPRPRRTSKRRAAPGSVQSLREIERNLS